MNKKERYNWYINNLKNQKKEINQEWLALGGRRQTPENKKIRKEEIKRINSLIKELKEKTN